MIEECTKTKYPSKKEAATARNWRTRGKKTARKGNRPAFLRIYRCQHCHFWHLTHRLSEQLRYHTKYKPKPENVPDEYVIL